MNTSNTVSFVQAFNIPARKLKNKVLAARHDDDDDINENNYLLEKVIRYKIPVVLDYLIFISFLRLYRIL